MQDFWEEMPRWECTTRNFEGLCWLNFRVQAVKEGFLNLKLKALRPFETPGSIRPTTHSYNPEDLCTQNMAVRTSNLVE
jgi:hypothetical protein